MPQLLKPAHSRACALQLLSPHAATTEANVPRAHALQRGATSMRSPRTAMKSSPCSPQLEKAKMQQRRPSAAKNLKKKKKYLRKKKLTWNSTTSHHLHCHDLVQTTNISYLYCNSFLTGLLCFLTCPSVVCSQHSSHCNLFIMEVISLPGAPSHKD